MFFLQVYCSQNVPQTFQCVFNVLITGDNFMARHVAADLLKRLVLAEQSSVSLFKSFFLIAPVNYFISSICNFLIIIKSCSFYRFLRSQLSAQPATTLSTIRTSIAPCSKSLVCSSHSIGDRRRLIRFVVIH